MTQGRKVDDADLVEISGGMDGEITEPQQDDSTGGTVDPRNRGDGSGGGGGGTGFDVTTGSGGTTDIQLGD
jgi:hypothetical protein